MAPLSLGGCGGQAVTALAVEGRRPGAACPAIPVCPAMPLHMVLMLAGD